MLTESSPSLLTTERQSTTIVTSSPDTSEKIIMKLDETDKILLLINREWAIDKVESAKLVGDKIAIYAEFEDWIEIDDVDNIEIISIEKEPENEDRI